MGTITVIIFILIAILVSDILSKIIHLNIPLPLIQIFTGAIISSIFGEGALLEPHSFILIFIPPLLFLDGWRISNSELKKEWSNIAQLSMGLIILTMLAVGYIIKLMIPDLPLPIAFALAAILAPTDPVAVTGITRKLVVPHRVMVNLEGEALFNDATGLVAFKMAVIVALTGHFSFFTATSTFVWVVLAGTIVGILTTRALYSARNKLSRKHDSELGFEILLSIMTPFISYLIAEYINSSGVLAAVASGITMSRIELKEDVSPTIRMQRSTIWDTIQYTLNGAIFIILGEQLPGIFMHSSSVAYSMGYNNLLGVLILATSICISLILVRLAWVFISLNITSIIKNKRLIKINAANSRDIILVSIGGVRGAITLAGILSLPLALQSSDGFPARDISILLAASVIIISIILASIIIPLLLKNKSIQNHSLSTSLMEQTNLALHLTQRRNAANVNILFDSIKDCDSVNSENLYSEIYNRLWNEITRALSKNENISIEHHQEIDIENKIRSHLINSTRKTIFELAVKGKISDFSAREMVKRLDAYDIGYMK